VVVVVVVEEEAVDLVELLGLLDHRVLRLGDGYGGLRERDLVEGSLLRWRRPRHLLGLGCRVWGVACRV